MAVVLGDFGGIGRAGIGAMLEAEGVDFENETLAADDVLARAAAGGMDVVLLDCDMPQADETASRLAAEHQDVRIIVCSLNETTMLVYPGRGALPYVSPLDPPRLAAVIREDH